MPLHAEVLPPREKCVCVHLRGLEELVDGHGDLQAQLVGDAAAGEAHVLRENNFRANASSFGKT